MDKTLRDPVFDLPFLLQGGRTGQNGGKVRERRRWEAASDIRARQPQEVEPQGRNDRPGRDGNTGPGGSGLEPG